MSLKGTQVAIISTYGENPLHLGKWLSMEGLFFLSRATEKMSKDISDSHNRLGQECGDIVTKNLVT